MARPQKDNAEYFAHDKGMRDNRKVKAVRQKFGLEGYAVWCMLIEALTDCDGFRMEWNELSLELLAGDFGLEPNALEQILDCFRRLKLIVLTSTELYSPGLLERMEPLRRDRERKRDWAREKAKSQDAGTEQDKGFSTSLTPQSKVKESKVKSNNVDNTFAESADSAGCEPPAQLKKDPGPTFEEFWTAYRYKDGGSKKTAGDRWNRLSPKDRRDAMLALPEYVNDTMTRKEARAAGKAAKTQRRYAEVFLSTRLWETYADAARDRQAENEKPTPYDEDYQRYLDHIAPQYPSTRTTSTCLTKQQFALYKERSYVKGAQVIGQDMERYHLLQAHERFEKHDPAVAQYPDVFSYFREVIQGYVKQATTV
jgi:hypothetical protein